MRLKRAETTLTFEKENLHRRNKSLDDTNESLQGSAKNVARRYENLYELKAARLEREFAQKEAELKRRHSEPTLTTEVEVAAEENMTSGFFMPDITLDKELTTGTMDHTC